MVLRTKSQDNPVSEVEIIELSLIIPFKILQNIFLITN